MKITIDTKEDSHDDIRRVVKMLEAWMEGHTNAPFNMFGDMGSGSGQSSGTDLFSIFDNKGSDNKGGPSSSSEKKDEDIPEIVPY